MTESAARPAQSVLANPESYLFRAEVPLRRGIPKKQRVVVDARMDATLRRRGVTPKGSFTLA